jgi:hypothetical protein
MLIHSRSLSPLSSCQGTPLAWTFVPGACPMIRMFEVALNCVIGRGPRGRCSAQNVHADISCRRASDGFAMVCISRGIMVQAIMIDADPCEIVQWPCVNVQT